MVGMYQDRGTLAGIARSLLALALIAERAAARSFTVRFLLLAVLWRAEAIARAYVLREVGATGWNLDAPLALHGGAAEAELLALRLRMLAAVLGALADANPDSGECTVGSPAGRAYRPGDAPHWPVFLLFRLPAARRSRPHDTS